jgi:hypothetical protein
MGCTTDSCRTAETWIRCLASHSVPLHATVGLSAHPDVAHLRNQAFGIVTIGLGEASRRSAELLALVRGWIARVIRFVTKMWDGISCRLIEPSSTLHRLRPYRSSNRTDRGAVHGPPWPTTLGGDNWSMARRRLSPYRSRASPRRKLPALTNFARPSLLRASAKRITIPTMRLYCTSAANNPLKNQ